MQHSLISLSILAALASSAVFAQEQKEDEANDKYTDRIRILGSSDKLRTLGGAASLIGELELESFEFDDINRVLSTVPGVNIREEDGYGLRPNIGLRGSTPERSKKITLMEDGVLIGPSPYSAPAAYYFPMISKMTAVEVFKGPAAIKYGPNTVSGAINLVTREIPEDFDMGIDLAYGSDNYTKAHAFHGETAGKWGYLVEGLLTQADGFKTIDNSDADTGFDKTDLMAKLKYDLSSTNTDQFIELKVSKTAETSNETYLGLSDDDFNQNPYRRYAASQVGLMDWDHDTIQLTHFIDFQSVDVTTRVYRHKFSRSWQKVKGFGNNAPSIQTVLLDPDASGNQDYYLRLSGQEDGKIVVGNNDRRYVSQGIQSDFGFKFNTAHIEHIIDAGIRVHQDEILRDHFEQDFNMLAGTMQNPQNKIFTTVDQEKSTTLALYIQDTIKLDNLTLTTGVRREYIKTHYQNRSDNANAKDDWLDKEFSIILPSVSAFYAMNNDWGLFAGVHQGFVPSSPKQNDVDVDAEKSVNYELGLRFAMQNTSGEFVTFFNDYSNLKESCSFSNASASQCPIDTDFNGGNVDVYGLEANLKHNFALTTDLELPIVFTYSYTHSAFKESFNSDFPQWGNITAGDEVPYMPNHQLSVLASIVHGQWQLNLLAKYTGEMQEAAGSGVELSDKVIEAHTTFDLSANYSLSAQHSLYAKIDNLTDEDHLVSRRPDGARPTKPRQGVIGYKFRF
ncbi:TonB-dependent receptor family protein [Algibacillus agarilyticus]|uniref:TonB-dependent receptor family protein n=1 Tax=Algibacillus agarilyticus TaxID=2234133 RepID=UPI000DD050B4|nr:TonB-dependent receptor [Algibacillus agarilyticus]